jgi:glutamine cyclotransferase
MTTLAKPADEVVPSPRAMSVRWMGKPPSGSMGAKIVAPRSGALATTWLMPMLTDYGVWCPRPVDHPLALKRAGDEVHITLDGLKVRAGMDGVLQQVPVPPDYFGEGITTWGQTIVQLTWQSQVGFVYDRNTFKQLRTFKYTGEGWGLTHNATELIMSDGSASLRFLDPKTLTETHRVLVTDAGIVVRDLNELEWVNGEIYANIWQTNFVARISPSTGRVLGWIDLSGLLSQEEQRGGADVLNGIAYDAAGRRLFVTGKLWPKLFEIQVVPGKQ